MKIGYNEATAKGCSSLEKDLILCEKAGFDYIEIRLDMLKEYLANHTVGQLTGFFLNNHLKPHALNALYIYQDLFKVPSDCRQEQLMKDFRLGCETAQAIGSHYFVIVPPLQPDPDGGPYIGTHEEITADCVRILNELSPIAKEYNVNLAFEVVGFERSSVRTVEHALEIIQKVNLKNVGLTLDAFNLYLYHGLNNFDCISSIDSDKIFVVHVNNGDHRPLHTLTQADRTFCQSGCVDLEQFLRAIKKSGYNDMVSIETFRPEYWEKEPEWVISQAFLTTKEFLQQHHLL